MADAWKKPDKSEALRPLRPFQQKTVDHVVEKLLEPNGSRRFLVADEVGLGKTLVARGVVAEFIDRHWNDVDQLDIIYLCSNAALARENIHKLRVGGDDAGKVVEATRFTLLPAQKDRLHKKLNFVSLTPGTAMRTPGGGIQDERLVLHGLLRQRSTGTWLTNFLQGGVGLERWRERVKEKLLVDQGTAQRFHSKLQERPGLLERLAEMETAFARVDGKAAAEAGSRAFQLIGDLRNLLARVCIDTVQPDLIILDEFQRFKDLLTMGDGEPSSETELAQQLFSYRTPEDKRVALLLLSATPYRMFTTSEETASDDHYRDFLQTLRFLVDDESRFSELGAAIQSHRSELLRAASGGKHDIAAARDRLQALLLRVMSRRERVGSTEDRNSMVCERKLTAPLSATDVGRYLALERLRDHLDGHDLMELWKSAPYVLNFAKGYEFKRSFEQNRGNEALAATFAQQQQAHLDPEQVAVFGELDSGSARLRMLVAETLDDEQWRMLWLPPSLPYWPLRGPWAKNPHFTKKLLFSAWNVVPDAVSALLSYELERRSLGDIDAAKNPSHADLYGKRTQPLRFAIPEGKPANMTTLALQLPCLRLAALHPLALRLAEGEDIRMALRPKVEALLGPLSARVTSSGSDPSWYWAALLLLDEDPAGVGAFLRGLEETHRHLRPSAGSEEDEGGESEPARRGTAGLAAHVRRALDVLNGSVELGSFPPDLVDVLVDFTLGSPAIAWARTLAGFGVSAALRRQLGSILGEAFRSLFNQPPILRMLQREDDARYWRATLHYAVDGNLQAVLDEFAHLLWEPETWAAKPPDEIARKVTTNAAGAIMTKTSSVHPNYYRASANGITDQAGAALRTHFALRYGNVRSGDQAQAEREDKVRDAFKSPFHPFVLTSTSVGQEGLDFHPWCHSVWHWNLPGNPVDLEQREGRVHRYKGHAVRKNVADSHGKELLATWTEGTDPWASLFALAGASRAAGESELVPCWLAPGPHKVERVVPILPMSREEGQLERLKRSLAIYRVVFGQPRQAELVELLHGASFTREELDSWVIRLEPPSGDARETVATDTDGANDVHEVQAAGE